MRRMSRHAEKRNPGRRGVTLVEMLVVVALTVLLMSIIAEVFVLASETLSRLRAVSDVNLRVRSIESILRTDLNNRTIREVRPPVEKVLFGAGFDGVFGTADDFYYLRPLGIDPAQNLGYFTIEENAPADEQGEDTDDVIAFTVRLTASSGQAMSGFGAAYFGSAVAGSEPDVAFAPAGDGIAGSQEAEIVYFLRRGTLYRRVLLVGVPQPSDTPALNPSRYAVPQPWYAHYDISARPAPSTATVPPWPVPLVNTLGDLSYRSTRFGNRLPPLYSTGDTTNPTRTMPILRSGLAADFPGYSKSGSLSLFLSTGLGPGLLAFADGNSSGLRDATTMTDSIDHNFDPTRDRTSYPYAIGSSPLSVPEYFTGRPTLRETSAVNSPAGRTWDYPDNANSNVFFQDPASFDPRDPLSNIPLSGAPLRAAEDVIAVNVLSFDIKVLDPDAVPTASGTGPATGAYVDLGKLWTGPTGASTGALNTPGPRPSFGSASGLPGLIPTPGGSPRGAAPFQWPPGPPLPWLGPDAAPGVVAVDDDMNGFVDDSSEIGYPGSDDVSMMGPDRRAGVAGTDDDNDGVIDNVSELFWAGSDDVRPSGRGFGMPFGWNEPVSPLYAPYLPCAIPPHVGADGQPGVAGLDDDGNGVVDRDPMGNPDWAELGYPGTDDVQPMLRCPPQLARTYDTWCTAYTKPSVLWYDDNNDGTFHAVDDRVLPVAPPYIVPLRGIQIKIRFVDPDSRLTREITIIQELQ